MAKSNAPVSDIPKSKSVTSPAREQYKGSDPVSTKHKGK